MNFIKVLTLVTVVGSIGFTSAQAEEVNTLPTIKVMADAELREEVGIVPYQDDKTARKSLQHQLQKDENEIQNFAIGDNFAVIDMQPTMSQVDMSHLSPLQQEYVLAVAAGLQSSDPTNGLFIMLQPLGIDRSKALDAVSNNEPIKFNFDTNRLNIMFGDKWSGNLPKR